MTDSYQLLADIESMASRHLHAEEDSIRFPLFREIIVLGQKDGTISLAALPILVEREDVGGVVIAEVLNVVLVVIRHHVGTWGHAYVINALLLLGLQGMEAQQQEQGQ
jgi:energy-converting hydrogenase Eha subunit G